jgi:hypothetical protein
MKLKKEYEEKVSKSSLSYHPLAGDFSMGSAIIYFWQALLKTSVLRSKEWNKFITSKFFKLFLFPFAYNEVKRMKKNNSSLMFEDMLRVNGMNLRGIKILAVVFRPITYIFYAQKLIRKTLRPFIYNNHSILIPQNKKESEMTKVSDKIVLKLKELDILK